MWQLPASPEWERGNGGSSPPGHKLRSAQDSQLSCREQLLCRDFRIFDLSNDTVDPPRKWKFPPLKFSGHSGDVLWVRVLGF